MLRSRGGCCVQQGRQVGQMPMLTVARKVAHGQSLPHQNAERAAIMAISLLNHEKRPVSP
jgi:hypothetical protein